jgi:hypothetical protein
VAWLGLGCGLARFRVRRGSVRVQRGSVGRAPACCKAGPSLNLGSAPQGGSPTEPTAMKKMETASAYVHELLYECCM